MMVSKRTLQVLLCMAALFTTLTASAVGGRKANRAQQETKTFAIEDETAAPELPSAKLVVGGDTKAAEAGAIGVANAAATAADSSGVQTAAIETAQPSEPLPVVQPDTSKLKESEIPVLTNSKDLKKGSGNQFHRLMITLGVLAATLGAVIFGLRRWTAKKGGKADNTRIKVLTQHHLGPKKSLAIIQVAGESLLIGVTDSNISMLKTLALIDDEFPETMPRSFDGALDDMDEDAEETAPRKGKRAEPREPEDFTMRGLAEIRDTVTNRLKNMRNL